MSEIKLYVGKQIVRDKRTGSVIDPFDQVSIDEQMRQGLLPTIIERCERMLLYTVNEVEVPPAMVGLVQLRSTFARLGLFAPPTYADAGFRGSLTLEVYNANYNPVILYPGMHMFNMVLVSAPLEPLYDGRYQDQPKRVVLPKALSEGDIDHSYYGF